MECAKIAVGSSVNCANPIQGGTKDKMWLFNFSDIEDAVITRNITNTQIIENIVLTSGVVGYAFEGANNSIMPKHTMVKGAFLNAYDHEINFKIFDLSPTVKSEIEKMAKGRFVAIVENNYKGATGNAAFEIYGLDSGLILEVLERDPSNADTQGMYDITLKSSEKSREAHLPASFFITDYPTTKAIVEGLV